MPELPEVETIVRGLGEGLPRSRVSRVVLGSVRKFRPARINSLSGRSLRKVSRRGKHIFLWFAGGQCLAIHLGMTGQLYWGGPKRVADRHTHLRLYFGRGDRVLYFRDVRRFGRVKLYPGEEALWSDARIAALGPEPLDISLGDFRKLLKRRRMIKALLLDQKVIVGFGNIYIDEALFAARIHPTRMAEALGRGDVARLHRAMKRVFSQAIAAGGSTIRDYRRGDGQVGLFQTQHKVYGKTGSKCPRCRTPIQRQIVAGRSTHTCPTCQPGNGAVSRS